MANKNIIVIGGGASGMMAALSAAGAGASQVAIYEKNGSLGRKLRITGKGRCNLTNMADVREILSNVPDNAEFLYSSLSGFGSAAVIDFFNGIGVATKIERGRRVFPVSDSAGDVVKALESELKHRRVEIIYNGAVGALIINEGKISGVRLRSGGERRADAVCVATGGASYPGTGSNGDGYALAKQAGHMVTAIRPSLVPLVSDESWIKDLEGLTLKNVGLAAFVNGKKIYSDTGEMLFTSRGVSGPLALTASRYISEFLDSEPVVLSIDLKPALDEKTLDARLMREFAALSNRDFINSLAGLFPCRLIPVVASLSGIPERKKINSVTREERLRLLKLIKNLRLRVTGTEGFGQAVITRGGVSVKEINPSTMESRLVKGLYFSGEVIDVDALTGGYNLQIAFSTGVLAGRRMAR